MRIEPKARKPGPRPHLMDDWEVKVILRSTADAVEMSRLLGVCSATVRATRRLETVKARRVFAAMQAEGKFPRPITKVRQTRNRFTPAQIAAIRASSVPSRALAAAEGCSSSLIRMIRTFRAYT